MRDIWGLEFPKNRLPVLINRTFGYAEFLSDLRGISASRGPRQDFNLTASEGRYGLLHFHALAPQPKRACYTKY
jgi:hypothetical protein